MDNNKRSLESSDDEPQAKILCEDILFDILNGDDDDDDDAGEESGDRDPAAAEEEVAAVMSSLEEEIGGGHGLPPVEEVCYSDSGCSPCQAELGYLLEASDDDLGLPPVTSSEGEERPVEILSGRESEEDSGFGQIWGFDEDVSGIFGGGFGMQLPVVEDGVGFEGGVFEYGEDELFGRSNFSDLSWRPESQPAV